jgi:hypothetical protein
MPWKAAMIAGCSSQSFSAGVTLFGNPLTFSTAAIDATWYLLDVTGWNLGRSLQQSVAWKATAQGDSV